MNDLTAGAIDALIAAAAFLGLHTWVQGQTRISLVIAASFCLLVVAAIARADREEEKRAGCPSASARPR
ncbi:hypothetical protein HNQ50_002248 [Silvimonas terrae]|uniref:Uncharacterized protein n=1 Tax=Silvimonas terrae TaxID=300266 RepID=A0A840RG70_9NEIS|nr:hypothetical protein [Silvimonas terrae]MBB5191518.1 hypothetical protein [Silvimonas terrae]